MGVRLFKNFLLALVDTASKTWTYTSSKTIKVTNCPKHVLQPQHNHGAYGSLSETPNQLWRRSLAMLWLGDTRKTYGDPSEYHNCLWLHIRTIRRRQMDNTTLTQSNLSVSSAVSSPSFSSMSKCVGESFATSACAKPVNCIFLIARKLTTRKPT